ncbi:MAG TPA: hypothetical protein GX731_04910 [Clostridiales bacterium]|jgi:uncharacterized membrane protein YczE|nr:hypothetical protein [Clostridiales bacterium]
MKYYKDKRRVIAVFIAVILMGLSLSFLIRVNFGTDPASTMNLGLAQKFGMSFGTWQILFNGLLLIAVLIFDRRQVGIGTVANMVIIGYSTDFFTWIFDLFIPENLFTNFIVRVAVLIPSLILFIFAAATYMSVELGSSPYDAVAFIIADKLKKIPFRIVRICYDVAAAAIGYLLGSTIGLVTVVVAFALGPVITYVKGKLDKYFAKGAVA